MGIVEAELNLPENSRYLAVKALKPIRVLLGSRGDYLYRLAIFLRSIDDEVDNSPADNKEQSIRHVEEMIAKPEGWPFVPEQLIPLTPLITKATKKQLLGIKADAKSKGLKFRSDEELKRYNWRTLAPCMYGLLLVVNEKPPKLNRKFRNWVQNAMTLASLESLGEDLGQGLVKLPMPLSGNETVTKEEVFEHYNDKKFRELKLKSIWGMIKNSGTFLEMDIPIWQKFICVGYSLQAAIVRLLIVTRNKAINPRS